LLNLWGISMADKNSNRRKPRIVVSDTEHERLVDLANTVLDRAPAVAEVLLDEMERADVRASDAMPGDVVRMHSTVEFRSDGGQSRRVSLVYPGEADIAEGKISVLTPVGTALIGLARGQSMSWVAPDGREHSLTVLEVEQGEAKG